MPITPTVGRIVWYHPAPNEPLIPGGEQPLAAIVAHVHSDTMINIAGFDANGTPFARTSVLLAQDDAPTPVWGYCEWMPYQKGQALKTEALETKVAELTSSAIDAPVVDTTEATTNADGATDPHAPGPDGGSAAPV